MINVNCHITCLIYPKALFALAFSLAFLFSAIAQDTVKFGAVRGLKYADIAYKAGNQTPYEAEACKLDIYMPVGAVKRVPVLIYFHGGGLVEGDKSEGWANWSNNFGYQFLQAGVGLVMVNYRLSGKNGTKWPAYLQDAALAVAWVQQHIAEYGGNERSIFVSGFSAGGYITHMLSIDPRWYAEIDFRPKHIRGYIPMSGQTRQHGNLAADLGVAQTDLMKLRPYAMPLALVKKTKIPIAVLTGGDEGQTITDNKQYCDTLVQLGSKHTSFYVQPGKSHVPMRDGLGDSISPSRDRVLAFIKQYQ